MTYWEWITTHCMSKSEKILSLTALPLIELSLINGCIPIEEKCEQI